ncbi:MAG: hypothetical protein AAGN66_06460 [Acidobacteriota bacterium]
MLSKHCPGRRRPRLAGFLRPLPLAFALAALVALPAAARDVRTEPPRPVENRPFQLIVSVDLGYSVLVEVLPPTLDGNVLRVAVLTEAASGGVIGLPIPAPARVFAVPIEPLPMGTYRVEIFNRLVEDGTDDLVFVRDALYVGQGLGLEVPSTATGPASDIPVTVSGIGSCPELFEPRVEGTTIVIPFEDICPILPPDARPFTFDTVIPGPLPAAEYTVELHSLGWPVNEAQLSVLPDPVVLRDGRFRVEVEWRDAAGEAGRGTAVAQPSAESALFYFFTEGNWELMVKVLDGCDLNQHHWVFAAGLTDVEYTLTVEDLETERRSIYFNALGTASPAITDTTALPCGTTMGGERHGR